MPYVDGVPYSGPKTSRKAAKRISARAPSMEQQVFEALSMFPDGLICDEIEQLLDLSHQTASARCRGLEQKERIFKTGLERQTRTGSPAEIYKVKETQ